MDKNIGIDWFDELDEDQQQAIIKSLKKLDNGEGIPHQEALKSLVLYPPLTIITTL